MLYIEKIDELIANQTKEVFFISFICSTLRICITNEMVKLPTESEWRKFNIVV